MSIAASFDNLASVIKQQLASPLDEWRMPWHNGALEPYNPISGHIYTGNNAIALIRSAQDEGYTSAKWAELSDWTKSKRKVQKGSIPTKIHRPIFCISTRDKKIDDKRIVGFKLVKLFNGDQIEAHDNSQLDLFDQFQNRLLIDDFIENCNANINFHDGNAYYNSECDSIFIPHRKNFTSSTNAPADHNYYATIIHELIHWTGHSTRLNRTTLGAAECKSRALEELIAELGTALICARFDNQIQPRTDHAAYLKSWLTGLDEEIYFGNAFKQAQEAIHYLYQLTGNDIHPLSYNSVKENDGHLEPESHEESEDDIPTFEQTATDTQQQNAETESEQAPLKPFVRTIRVNAQCHNCSLEYDVTLMRYEAVSICPGCFAGNHHRLVW
jgi:antirestriction protein ArdC